MKFLRSVSVLAAAGFLLAVPVSSYAEGPGYGGTAGQLSVTWVSANDASQQQVSNPPATPEVAPTGVSTAGFLPVVSSTQLDINSLALKVQGLGFRGKSQIEIRVGSDDPVLARADSAGAVDVAVPANKVGESQPGTSVMAVGRNQSGTEVVLFGSVPPKAGSAGPSTYVPWVVLAIIMVALIYQVRKKLSAQQP